MILVDSSAWIEFLRATGSDAHLRLRELLGSPSLAVTDVVLMEILAGGRDPAERRRLRALLSHAAFLPTSGPLDFESAAEAYAACRRGGETVRSLIGCLVAAVAIRTDSTLLHADADFEVLARHTPLRLG